MLNHNQPTLPKVKWNLVFQTYRIIGFLLFFLLLVTLLGCKSSSGKLPLGNTEIPSPTTADFFETALTPTQKPTRLPSPTTDPSEPPISITDALTVTIYSDVINPDWLLIGAQEEEINLRARSLVHEGAFSIAITPKKTNSQVFFLLDKERSEIYPRPQVHGFRFRLNPGNTPLDISKINLAILGGNEDFAYIDPKSIQSDYIEEKHFSDYYVFLHGFHTTIPPNTWTEVTIWLNDPVKDPDFQYILGLLLSIDDNFLKTIFIDDIQLILAGRKPLPTQIPPTSTPTNTPTPTSTSTPTPTNTNTPLPPRFTSTPLPTKTPDKVDQPDKPKNTQVSPTEPPTPPPVIP